MGGVEGAVGEGVEVVGSWFQKMGASVVANMGLSGNEKVVGGWVLPIALQEAGGCEGVGGGGRGGEGVCACVCVCVCCGLLGAACCFVGGWWV